METHSNSASGIFLVRYGSSDHAFERRSIPLPTAADLKEDQVLIEVEASGLNFADIMARQGLYREAPPLPALLGYEVVGHIVATRSKLHTVGTRVLAFTRFGGYASHAITVGLLAVPISEKIPAAEATALATQGCTAYYAAEEMVRIQEGDHVLVQAAAGGVGSLLVQLAKLRGAVVYGTASTAEKLNAMKPLGLDVPISYVTEDFEVAASRELKKHGRPGMDVVFDSIGGDSVKKGLRLLGPGGRIVCYGAAQMSGDRKNFFRMLKTGIGFGFLHPAPLMMKSKGVIGVNLLRLADERHDVLARCLKGVVELAQQGKLKVLKTEVFPVDQVGKAHERLGSRSTMGKVALIWKTS